MTEFYIFGDMVVMVLKKGKRLSKKKVWAFVDESITGDQLAAFFNKHPNNYAWKCQSDNPLLRKYIALWQSARNRKKDFNLPFSYFDAIHPSKNPCIFCGEKASGFDRLDSGKGYIVGNIQPCCGRCNLMKHTASVDVFTAHALKIVNNVDSWRPLLGQPFTGIRCFW